MDCKSCGHTLEENYCPSCGEKKFDPKQLSVKHFAEETFEGLVHFDNKFLHTLKTLLTKPGRLSLDYAEGKRVKYMKPVQFFLVVNLIFFFFIIGNLYSLPLSNYTTYKPFTDYHTKELVQQKLQHLKMTDGEYRQLFDEKIEANSKEFIFLFIPFYGLVFALLFFMYKRQLVEHLIFATHFIAFMLCWFFIQSYLIVWPFYLFTHDNYNQLFDNISSLFTSMLAGAYFIMAAKTFYKKHLLWLIITGLLIGYTFFTVIQYYRMLLFFKIIYFG
jgi:hypothetical protein